MAWHDDITDLTLTVDGSVVGDSSGGSNRTLLSASWGAGRSDWFGSLAPASASFMLLGDLSGSIILGDDVVLSMGASTLWAGTVDSLTVNEAAGQTTTISVSATDTVGTLGEAKVYGDSLLGDTIDDQLVQVLGFADISASVIVAPHLDALPTLGAIDPMDTTVLDWVTQAERESNAFITSRGNGDLVIAQRDQYPDYGQRVVSGISIPQTVPAASSLWRMDEASGNIADTIGGITGTKVNTPTYHQQGPWGANGPYAIGFQKVDADAFTFGSNYGLLTAAWTIAGWVKWDGTTVSTHWLLRKVAAGPDGWGIGIGTDGKLFFQAWNAGANISDVHSTTSMTTDWTHFAVIKTGGNVYILLDGAYDAGGPIGSIPSTAANLRMGGDGAGGDFGGYLSNVAIWAGSALSDTQLYALAYLGGADLTGDLAPRTWSADQARSRIINRFEFEQFAATTVYENAASIAAYGQRTMAISSNAFTDLADVYEADFRGVVANPHPLVTATFGVEGHEHDRLITLEPVIGFVARAGVTWQVLQVSHDVSPDEWRVTLTLDRTQNDLMGRESLLPV